MKFLQKQKGVGTVGFIILLAIVGFVLYIAWKLTPMYVENYALKKEMKSIQGHNVVVSSVTLAQNTNKVRNFLAKNFRVNNIYNIPLESIRLRKIQGEYTVEVSYEVRKHLIGNLDVIARFNESVQVKGK